MTKWGRRLFSIAFSFMFLFISIGYAQIADTLIVNGTAAWQYKGVYITSIEKYSENGVEETSAATHFIPTNAITALKVTGAANGTREIVYKITAKNNTNYKYSYKGIVCEAALDGYDNNLYGAANGFTVALYTDAACTNKIVEDDPTVKDDETAIDGGETLEFYAKYTFTNTAAMNTEVKALVNYSFDIHIDSLGDMAAAQAAAKFLSALNDPVKYAELTTNIDNKFENPSDWGDENGDGYINTGSFWNNESVSLPELWEANYIGNVDGSSESDKAVVQDMLEGLQITIDGETQDVKAIIKRIDVDGNTNTGDAYIATFNYQTKNNRNVVTDQTYSLSDQGCEMVLYMTADNLDGVEDPGEYGEAYYSGELKDAATVYVIVLTCKNDGTINDDGTTNITSEWYQIGDIYEGHCPIVGYSGGTGTGSFVTDDWTSTGKTYKVTENYSYTIGDGDGRGNNIEDIREVIQSTDANANAEYTALMAEAEKVMTLINEGLFNNSAWTSVVNTMQTTYEKASAMNVTGSTLRAELIPILQELENAIYPFTDYIT